MIYTKVVNFALTERDNEKINEIRQRECVQSRSEVIRRAVDLLWRNVCEKSNHVS